MRQTCTGIQLDIGIAQDFLTLLLASSQKGLDTCHQFFRRKRLDQIVVSPHLKTLYPMSNSIAGREHEDGYIITCRTQSPCYLQPGDSWEHDIQHDEIGRTLQCTV